MAAGSWEALVGVIEIQLLASEDPYQKLELLHRIARRRGRAVSGFTPRAMQRLVEYDFPGNVRELENILEQALVIGHGPEIDENHLPRQVRESTGLLVASATRPSTRAIMAVPLQQDHQPTPARKLSALLQAHGWNRQKTADALGISRSTLWRRMKEYGLIE